VSGPKNILAGGGFSSKNVADRIHKKKAGIAGDMVKKQMDGKTEH
jgi:hypothetical protein